MEFLCGLWEQIYPGTEQKQNLLAEKTRLLEMYISELELFNSAYDLVGALTREEITRRHIFDSLAGGPIIQKLMHLIEEKRQKNGEVKKVSIVDVGSGAGFPGIPLAVLFPETNVTLLERMSKRCSFLENCGAVLGLKNLTVFCQEAEKVPKARFDLAVFRAFRPLDEKMTKTLLSLIVPDGFLAAYKAKKSKITEEMKAISALVPFWQLEKLQSNFLQGTCQEGESYERHMVIIPGTQGNGC